MKTEKDINKKKKSILPCQVQADRLCNTAMTLLSTRTSWCTHTRLETPLPAHNDHAPLELQQRFTLRELDGSLITSKPRTTLYDKIAQADTPKPPSNPLATHWRLPSDNPYLHKLRQGTKDRECLKFHLHSRSNLLFTEPHWQAYTATDDSILHGPLLPCHRCHMQTPPTLTHVFMTCPANSHAFLLADQAVARDLAKLGGAPWHLVLSIEAEVTALLAEHHALTLRTIQMHSARTTDSPKELPIDHILQHGLPVKPANRAGTVFPARDNKARREPTKPAKRHGKYPPEHDVITVINIAPPPNAPSSSDYTLVPHRAAALWRAFTPHHSQRDFASALWHLCHRDAPTQGTPQGDQWWSSRPLLQHTLHSHCNVLIELFSSPLTQSTIPCKFSAHPDDTQFGFQINCLVDATGKARRWAHLPQQLCPTNDRKLIALYANPEYLTQLHTLLEYALRFTADGNNLDAPLRLYAFLPLGTAITETDLARTGATLLVLFAHGCYDFIPYAHWTGHAHTDAHYSLGAPMQMALVMWETDAAAAEFPLSPLETQALREWATMSCTKQCHGPASTKTMDPTPHVSFGSPLAEPTHTHHPRLHTFYHATPPDTDAPLGPAPQHHPPPPIRTAPCPSA